MRFLSVQFPSALPVPQPDPRTAPGDVPDSLIAKCPFNNPGSDRQPSRILLTSEGTAAATVTVSLFAQREGPVVVADTSPGDTAEKEARRFYEIATGVIITVGVLTEVATPADAVPPGGLIYIRPTARSGANNHEILIACAD